MRKNAKITTGIAVNTWNWELIFIYSVDKNGGINYTSYRWGMGAMGANIVAEQIEMFSSKNKKHMRLLHQHMVQLQDLKDSSGNYHHVIEKRGDEYCQQIVR